MNYIIDFFKGCIVGVANIIPGVSGGTLALTLGIYHKMLSAISNLFHDFKNSVKALAPILLGCAAGICVFSFIIPFLIETYPVPTILSFIGLIAGGVPMLYKEYKKAKKSSSKDRILAYALFLFFFVGSIFLASLNASDQTGSLTPDLKTIIILFFVGIIAAATMIIPGISGSLILMILGYYFGIVTSVKDFLTALKHFDIATMFSLCTLLVPFGIGVLLGLFYVAKVIKWLMENKPTITYASILGLIFASPVTIFLKTAFTANDFLILPVIIGIVLMTSFCIVSYRFSSME